MLRQDFRQDFTQVGAKRFRYQNLSRANLPVISMSSAQIRAKFLTALLFIAIPAFTEGQGTAGADQKLLVYHVELAEDIMPPAWRTIKQAMEEAESLNADIIILSLDTYGGMVNIADSISQRLLHAKAMTMVFIVNNAASAGALISISCDSIYMASSAQIGAATVVNGTDGAAMPDKYQAYMRAKMRSIAEANGRDPDIAEAMVDDDSEIPGIIEAGKTLVFTSSEAVKNGYCEGIASSWQDCLKMAGVEDYELVSFKPTAVDRIIKFLVNPVLSGVLLMIIFIGIYTELQAPGIGFSLLAAAVAAVLYFAPHYLDGLAAHWEIAMFIVGVVLLTIELFAFPGFGAVGLAGITLMVSSLVLSMIGNDNFDFRLTATQDIVRAVLVVVLSLLTSLGIVVTLLGSLTGSPLLQKLVLTESQEKAKGFTVDAYRQNKDLTGAHGITASELRPSGKIDIGTDRFDAMTEGGFIAKGQMVKVIAIKNNYLLVRETEAT